MVIEPSLFWWFSMKAIRARGVAITVLFNVWAKYFSSLDFTLMFSRRACASVKLEQEATSKYFSCLGDHASMSAPFAFKSAKSPEQDSRTRIGISSCLNRSTVRASILSYHL